MFLNNVEASNILLQDSDNYVHNLSAADLHARKVTSSNEYLQIISRSTLNFSEIHKTKLRRCCKKADDFLRKFTYFNMNCNIIANIHWKIAYTDMRYEEGMPHTRMDVIFLSKSIINDYIASDGNDNPLVTTLIHEKIHVFQKIYPQIANKLVTLMGYRIVDSITDTTLKRSNPDINNDIYMNANKTISMISYKTTKPSGINDIKPGNGFASEHPYEHMAYEIAGAYDKLQWKNVPI